MGFVQEFKTFAVKGNAVDLAVGIVIGAAFNKIVQSLVNDIIMPAAGLIVGGKHYANLKVVLRPAVEDAATQAVVLPEVAVRYGLFLAAVIDFLIVALVLFFVVRTMNKIILRREAEAEKKA